MRDYRRNSRAKNKKKNRLKNIKDNFIDSDKKKILFILIVLIFVVLLIIYISIRINKYNDRKEELKHLEEINESVKNINITEEEIKEKNDTRIKIGFFGNINYSKVLEDINDECSEIKKDIEDKNLSVTYLNNISMYNKNIEDDNVSNEIFNSISNLGFDVLDLSNINTDDLNENRLEKIKNEVDTNNISELGISNSDDLKGQLIKDVKGIKIGFLSYIVFDENNTNENNDKLYLNIWNDENVENQIKTLKENADFIVVDVNQNNTLSEDKINSIVELLVKNNVDVIIFTNSNEIKRLEMQTRADGNQTLISYGLGNLISDNNDLSLMLEVQIVKKAENGKIILTKVNYDPIYNLNNEEYKLVNVRRKLQEYESKVDINDEKSLKTLENEDEMVYNILSQQLEKTEKIIGREEQ